jgi:uncharacterized protein (TIGR00725 family)
MEPSARAVHGAACIAVVGPGAGDATKADLDIALEVGGLLADQGAIVVCGGMDGVMEAACRGASERGGLTVGILPGRDRTGANAYLTIALPTGLGELRNGLVVGTSEAVIAVGGSWGTLSEIGLAMRTRKPTIVLGGWTIQDPAAGRPDEPHRATSAMTAVADALEAVADARRRAFGSGADNPQWI